MPEDLPERAEAGTLNVPGIAGLNAGMNYVQSVGIGNIFRRQRRAAEICIRDLRNLGHSVFFGEHHGGTVSFVPNEDCETFAQRLAEKGIAVRAGLHCAPLAHESAGTLESGTVRISFGHDASLFHTDALRSALEKCGN
jgi:selenocysteine lyase/cysteine desulfurase